jgi:STE24 endopeptidase
MVCEAQAEQGWQDKAKRWGSFCLRVALLRVALVLAWTALIFLSGASVSLRSWLEKTVSTSVFAVVPIFLTVVLASYGVVALPLDWLAWRGEVRYELSRKRAAAWLRLFIVGGLVRLVFGVAFFYVAYMSFFAVGRWWWLATGLISLGADVLVRRFLLRFLISLHHRLAPIGEAAVVERLKRIAERSGTGIKHFLEMKVKKETPAANAMVGGVGKRKAVFFTDTLLDAFSGEEIESIAAHELGHERGGHLTYSIFLNFAVITSGLLVAHLGLLVLAPVFPHLGIREPADLAAFPLLLLFLILYRLAMTPAWSAISRLMERSADCYALTLSSEPGAFASAIEKLARMDLIDPDPPWFARLISAAPPPRERVEAAQTYADRKEKA